MQEQKLHKNGIENLNTSKKKTNLLTDITDLLILPQKIAAAKLGMTESMLSKKFKEATNRKWPYRYLKKLERDMEEAKNEEQKEKLTEQREELLSPVSIYVKRIPTKDDKQLILQIDND